MPIYALGSLAPDIHPDAFIHPDAVIIGSVRVGAGASFWPNSVARGDYGRIEVGDETSIQDGTVIHATARLPTVVGARCVIGHIVHLEGCTIGNDCLIGSGAVVLGGSTVEPGAGVAAAALVPEQTIVRTGYIAMGVPAREKPAEKLAERTRQGATRYREMAYRYRDELRRIS